MYPELAGKITGMLLEIDNSDLVHMLEHQAYLKGKVEEAVSVLQVHQNKMLMASAPPQEQKQMLGELLFPLIQGMYQYRAVVGPHQRSHSLLCDFSLLSSLIFSKYLYYNLAMAVNHRFEISISKFGTCAGESSPPS